MKRSCWVLAVGLLGGIAAHAEIQGMSLASAEGFGSMAFQTVQGAGSSFAGGAHWTPTLGITEMIDAKLMLGGQTFKSTSLTGSKVYVVADYLAAAQLNYLEPFKINAGFGAGTDLRSGGKTRLAVMLGADYPFKEKLLGLFDRAVVNGHYYFASSSLWIVHYGLGVDF